jgi:hypothetical protein
LHCVHARQVQGILQEAKTENYLDKKEKRQKLTGDVAALQLF